MNMLREFQKSPHEFGRHPEERWCRANPARSTAHCSNIYLLAPLPAHDRLKSSCRSVHTCVTAELQTASPLSTGYRFKFVGVAADIDSTSLADLSKLAVLASIRIVTLSLWLICKVLGVKTISHATREQHCRRCCRVAVLQPPA